MCKVHLTVRQIGYDNVEQPCRDMHEIEVLNDEGVFDTIECLAKINACCKE